ncbi:MAG: hybrid sensor histidine kinase/response regulator [SAR324 cluster bacterium]|nr:hybrid sensor histidine kinase/response regulator [SAR324 cluster bacterium]
MEEQSVKILLVDDKESNLFAFKKALDVFDFEIITAYSGQQALEIILKNEFAVILMDVQMPEMDGLETAELMRVHTNTPIIFITAYRKEKQYVFQGYESGAVDYIFKPVDSYVLRAKISAFVEMYQQKQDLKKALHDQEILAKRLKDTSEKLEKRNQQMNQFVGILSHDLRSPFNTMLSFARMLQEKVARLNPGQDILDMLTAIERTGNRASELVDEILALTAIEGGQFQIEFQRCSLNQLLKYAVEDLKPAFEQKKIKIIFENNSNHFVSADPLKLNQVFDNLLNNAIKFTPESGQITIRTIPETDGVQTQVIDTGVGIAPEKIPLLFEKHHKISTSGTKGEKGTGFGLPLVHELLQAHHSQLHVQSEVNKGSCFSFMLPYWNPDKS